MESFGCCNVSGVDYNEERVLERKGVERTEGMDMQEEHVTIEVLELPLPDTVSECSGIPSAEEKPEL